jgi:hypothetical protein
VQDFSGQRKVIALRLDRADTKVLDYFLGVHRLWNTMPERIVALYTGKYLAESYESVQSVTPTFLLRYVASRILADLLIAISELRTKVL